MSSLTRQLPTDCPASARVRGSAKLSFALGPSDTQCRRRLGLAASPAASGRDWGLKSQPKAGTGPGLGTGVPTEGWDWDWHERAKAETDSDWRLKSTQ